LPCLVFKATPFSPTAPIAAVLCVVRSMLMNMSSSHADSLPMNLVVRDERATASALNAVVWRTPNATSKVVGAAALIGGDFSLPFHLCTVLYVASITVFHSLFRKVEHAKVFE
jgi:predicted MFS family arabinose efflux permease